MAILRPSALYAPTFDKKLQRMLDHSYADPNFSTALLRKDLRLFLEEATTAGLLAEMREEWPLCFEDMLFAAGHHQQRSVQCLWFAPEHRGFQIPPSLVHNLCGELAAFVHPHGPHRDHR